MIGLTNVNINFLLLFFSPCWDWLDPVVQNYQQKKVRAAALRSACVMISCAFITLRVLKLAPLVLLCCMGDAACLTN